MSPELFDPEIENRRPTEYSDCYALGMVMYEVLSGRIPFYEYPNRVIPWKVFRGDRPERPQGAGGVWFTDEVWKVLQTCWTHQAENRARIEGVLQRLEEVSRSWIPPSPRLLVVPSTTDSLAQGFSDIVTTESTDTSGSSQPLEELDREESAGTISQQVNGRNRSVLLTARPLTHMNPVGASQLLDETSELPDTTEARMALVAQGSLDPVRASQVLVKIFDAHDYLTLLYDHPQAQQYVDGLYKVYCSYFCKYSFHSAPGRPLVTYPMIQRCADVASGHSERREG